jgi:acyl transferase domain-containing protein
MPREELISDQTALLFPTGGYYWPGMGADVEATADRELFDRADAALEGLGVPRGALRRLMAGEGQAKRARSDSLWVWTGDFALSMVAQTALGVALARSFERLHGSPKVLVGESMGEIAAYCVAQVLSIEQATVLTWRWARDLQLASDALGPLRMAVVEDLDGDDLGLLEPLAANIVVVESPHLFVVGLPVQHLPALEREVARQGGRILVSNNHCAAHEPRLAERAEVWSAHEAFLRSLTFDRPRLTILSTLDPGAPLAEPAALLKNRIDTSFQQVRWAQTLATLPALGVKRLVQLGPISSAYALKKLRSEEPRLAEVRIDVVGTLATVAALAPRLDPADNRSGSP